jgi:hypothetical protein
VNHLTVALGFVAFGLAGRLVETLAPHAFLILAFAGVVAALWATVRHTARDHHTDRDALFARRHRVTR